MLLAVLLVLALALGGVWWLTERSRAERAVVLGGSGIVEATEVDVGTEQPGRIAAMWVREGQGVRRGQILAVMDTAILRQQVRVAEAGVRAALANLNAAADDGDDAEVRIARAQLDQARAQLAIARAQLAEATVRSPLAGVVLDVALKRGEIASAGQTLLRLADLTRLKLVVFVPEPLIGRVKVGSTAAVSVDAFPGRSFEATVTEVAEQAEFTPTSVQTKEQRTKLVYAVTLRLADPEHLLRPGMPADALIEE